MYAVRVSVIVWIEESWFQRGHFTLEDYWKWLKEARRADLARALRRLAQPNQTEVYLFWKRSPA